MKDFFKVVLASDIIIEYNDGSIILIKRGNDPYKDMWALPGGLMDEGETIEETAVREAKEETGLDVKLTALIGVYSKPGRDPRGRTVTITYSAKAIGGIPEANDDAKEILQTTDYADMKLAFDHNEMIADFLKQKNKPG
ncbi:MAG TPA: NUDIX hydrolase [Bacteroidia bacterium]|nr:NUDIX hydrolase [Bacteroidia bacterium]